MNSRTRDSLLSVGVTRAATDAAWIPLPDAIRTGEEMYGLITAAGYIRFVAALWVMGRDRHSRSCEN
jgi:hypothetical protein